jgi:hypothetical protein
MPESVDYEASWDKTISMKHGFSVRTNKGNLDARVSCR